MIRLSARFWVDAYLARLRVEAIPGFVTAHGDDTGGAILVKLNTLDGQARLYQRRFDLMTDRYLWEVMLDGAESDVDGTIARQCRSDPDLWVIEVEDRQGRHFLEPSETLL